MAGCPGCSRCEGRPSCPRDRARRASESIPRVKEGGAAMSGVQAPTTAVIKLSAQVVVSPVTEESGVVDTVVSYSMRDPYEIQISFRKQGNSVVWKFARDLLVEAKVEGKAGEGDVQVDWTGEDCVVILHGDGSFTARVALTGRRISTFLARITRMVPLGSETRFLQISDHLPAGW